MTSSTTPRLQRRRAFFRRLRLYGYGSGIVLLLVGLGYLVLGSPLFKIGEFTITGAPRLDRDQLTATLKAEIAANSRGWLGPDNYLAWPEALQYTSPLIKDVSVKKSFWSRRVAVAVTPRERYLVWCAGNNGDSGCYWIDDAGFLIEYAPVAEGQLVQTVFDTGEALQGSIGTPVLPPEEFSVVKDIIEGTKKMDLSITRISVDHRLQEIRVNTAQGARVIFSLRFDPKPAALPAVARFIQKPGLSKIDYINLTVENRAFLKQR